MGHLRPALHNRPQPSQPPSLRCHTAARRRTASAPRRWPPHLEAVLPPLPLQEVRGKFDLKEPYYRQQVQWMMQMTQPAADGGSADDASLLQQHQQQQAPPAVAQQQMDVT